MKLKYIFASIVATLALAVSCEKEAEHFLKEVQVSSSFLSFPAEGGNVDIIVNATDSWQIQNLPEWISVSPANGSAGENTVHFSAGSAESTREGNFTIECGGKTQSMRVIQATEAAEPTILTCKEVIAMVQADQAISQEVYFKGIVCKIDEISPSYGNATFYLSDDGSFKGSYNADGSGIDDPNWVEVYRGKWLNGANFTTGDEFGIGDEMVITGIIMSYKGTPETNQGTASVVSIKKSLIDVEALKFDKLPAIDTTFSLMVTAKESPLLVSSDADWLQITGVNTDGSYQLHADANPRTAERQANISIVGPTARKSVSVTQAGVPATGATVSEIIAMDDDSQVQTLPSTVVVALTTRGAVLSDGTKAIYAYGNTAAALKLGDGVQMSARKTTYNGVPELTDISDAFVDSEGNAVSYPNAKDITAQAGSYSASEAEYVKLSGTLSVSSDGKYYNIALDGFEDGSKQGSIVYPVEALNAKSFDGKKITVTGFFNGLSSGGKYINIVATKIAEFVDNPKGTANNPYAASEIAAEILAGNIPEENVYVKGIVSAIQGEFSSGYGNATFWISDDGTAYGVSEDKKSTTEPSKDFECYRVLWFDNKKWEDGNAQISVGDEIVVYGKMTAYNGIAETSGNKAWVYSVNGATNDADGIGNALAPFNVAGAEAFIDRMVAAQNAAKEAGESAPVFPNVCVKGIVSAVQSEFSAGYGNGTFWISDDGKAYGISEDKKSTTAFTKDFECYRVLWFNNEKWADGNPQIAVGDEVIIKGQLTQYNGIYETSGNKAWIYSLNGKTE